MLNVCETFIAGANELFPYWCAVTVQLPVSVAEIVDPSCPEAWQTPLAVKVTGSPEDAVAVTEIGSVDICISAIGSKLIVCELRL